MGSGIGLSLDGGKKGGRCKSLRELVKGKKRQPKRKHRKSDWCQTNIYHLLADKK
jgi:hypothetical protein